MTAHLGETSPKAVLPQPAISAQFRETSHQAVLPQPAITAQFRETSHQAVLPQPAITAQFRETSHKAVLPQPVPYRHTRQTGIVVIFLNSFAVDLLPAYLFGEVMVLGPVVCGLVIVLPALRIVMQVCFKAPGAFWGLGAAQKAHCY